MPKKNEQLEELKVKLVEMLGLQDVPEERHDELIGKMSEALVKRIFVATTEKLSDEELEEYKALIDRDAPDEEMKAFLEGKIPNYNGFVRGVAEEFFAAMRKSME